MKIIKNYLTKNRCYITGAKRTPIGIQIHTIGTGQGTAQSVADYWNQSAVSACVTYCVDADTPGKVLQFLPEWMRSWADAGWGNNNLITIEICESDYIRYTGGANYDVLDTSRCKADILRGYHTAVELCADICGRYGWNPKAKLKNGMHLISSHREGNLAGLSSNHGDPDHIWKRFGLTMDGFRKDVAAAMKPLELKAGMKVRLTQAVAIRTGVSTKTNAAGYVPYAQLSESAKKKASRKGKKARLKSGTVVGVLETRKDYKGYTWIRIKSGWLPVVVGGKYRVTEA